MIFVRKLILTLTIFVPVIVVAITIPTVPKVPTVPEVPKVSTIYQGSNTKNISTIKEVLKEIRGIKFSNRVPPNYIPHRFDNPIAIKKTVKIEVGEVYENRVSAYLRGEFIDVETAIKRLKKAGFQVLISLPINKTKTLTSIIFTDQSLVKMASIKEKGFMASLRLVVDTKSKNISITNPIYLSKGFMQDKFDKDISTAVLMKILNEFPNLKNSKDALKFQLLPKYQFIKGMPQYQHMTVIASGNDLLERVQNNVKTFISAQKLENGSTLVFVKLSNKTRTFIDKIGRNNAGMLPYPVLIEDGKAKILDPRYYISVMYPLLKMSQFMTIASVPDAMIKDCKRAFKKQKQRKETTPVVVKEETLVVVKEETPVTVTVEVQEKNETTNATPIVIK